MRQRESDNPYASPSTAASKDDDRPANLGWNWIPTSTGFVIIVLAIVVFGLVIMLLT